jgi:hypothetical protein
LHAVVTHDREECLDLCAQVEVMPTLLVQKLAALGKRKIECLGK